jgi:hypothetical protein
MVLCREVTRVLLDESENDDELAKFGFEQKPYNSLNALSSGGMQRALFHEFRAVGDKCDYDQVTILKLRLEAASVIPKVLVPLVEKMHEVLPKFQAAHDAYMKPRRDAVERGKALAESMMAVPPIEDR